MKSVFRDYLFKKHILVCEGEPTKAPLETLVALADLFAIRITGGREHLWKGCIRYVSWQLGIDVPEPFYRGFPETPRQLPAYALLLDQLAHYGVTYGEGDFSEAGHSVFEEVFTRTAFKEEVQVREFVIVTPGEAEEILKQTVYDLMAGTRPLGHEQYKLVKAYLEIYTPKIPNIASKDTCVRLLLDTRDLRLARFLSLSDVIRLLDEMQFTLYRCGGLNELNLKNRDRRFISAVIDTLIDAGKCDLQTCFEKKKIWNGLLHHLHYIPKTAEAAAFVRAMRGDENHSVYAAFEKEMAAGDCRTAADVLIRGKGGTALLRHLDYILSRCGSGEEISGILARMQSDNVIVLVQLLLRYGDVGEEAARTFAFTKHGRQKVHCETPEETSGRRSRLTKEQRTMLSDLIRQRLREVLRGRLGRVYIDPDMENYALPLQETASQDGFGVLPRGSRIHMGEAKKIRAFTYWEKVNDIDLSVIGIDEDGTQSEFSWRTMYRNQSHAITYSGDETSGFNGGSEYFDVVPDRIRKAFPRMRYLVFCDNVFSRVNFSDCYCKAGYMLRDEEDSGEIFEPKTVQSSFVVQADSTFAYLFAIDLPNRDFIWLNAARAGNLAVAGDSRLSWLTRYFTITSIINVRSFFEMMAAECVASPDEAQIIVTDKTMEAKEGVEIIREYNIERMIALLNQ